MTIDLVVFLVILLFLLVVGLPAIRQTVTLPSDLETEEVPRSRLSKALTEHYDSLDRELIGLGFTPLLMFRVVNLGSDNTLRLYLHSNSSTFALGTCIGQDTPNGRVGQNYLEFIDEFSNGRSLTSRNAGVASVFAVDPNRPVKEYPDFSPDSLLARHREACIGLGEESRSWSQASEILKQGRQAHREMCQFQAECGYLEFDSSANRFRATYRLALFGLVNFINPFADNFTWPRFVFTVVLAGIPPILGLTHLSNALAPLRLAPLNFEFAQIFAKLVIFGISGGIVGWSFPGKTFIWGFLATYAPIAFLGVSDDWVILYCIFSSLIADWVSTFRLARSDLHRQTEI